MWGNRAMRSKFRPSLLRNLRYAFEITSTAALGLLAAVWLFSSMAAAGALDGREYSARIVRSEADGDGKKPPLGDKLTFKDGKFSSEVCRRFNFVEAPYWVREENGQIHFLAELTSPTDGTMVWKGSIRGDALEGTMRWTKKRWYWTIDTEHKIRGKLEHHARPTLPTSN